MQQTRIVSRNNTTDGTNDLMNLANQQVEYLKFWTNHWKHELSSLLIGQIKPIIIEKNGSSWTVNSRTIYSKIKEPDKTKMDEQNCTELLIFNYLFAIVSRSNAKTN